MSREHDSATAGSAPVPTVVRRARVPAALRVLRDRTSSAHAGLDGALAGDEHRVSDEASYLRLLGVLAPLHATTEPPLHAWVARTPWVGEALGGAPLPDRADLYADDLAALGEPGCVDGADGADGANSTDSPVVEEYDDARGLAALYLLAGSSKGARVLLRGLPDDVAPEARRGLSDAASRDSARLWGAVVGVLGEPLAQARPADHLELAAEAADRAVEVFARLHGLAGEQPAVSAVRAVTGS